MTDVMHRAASHEAVPDRELSGRGCRPLCPSRPSQTGVNCLRCCSTPEEQLWEGLSWDGVLDEAPFNRRVSASFSLSPYTAFANFRFQAQSEWC